jgi:hypothetical protein
MIAFPGAPVGTIGRLIVLAAIGIAVAQAWPMLPDAVRVPDRRIANAITLGIVALVGLTVFWPVLAESPSPEWQTGDWGPQHAVLARIMPHLPGLDVPVWNHAVSTGDAPLELYPALTYLVTGHLALLLGLEHDLPHAFMIVAALTHLGLALATTALAMRIASRPIAVIVGVFWLVDSGAISHGGTVGLFHWALLHSAFAHLWSMIAALGILTALHRPRLGASVTIWIGVAVSTAAHPAALITSATFGVALCAVALLAGDIKPRRALAALGHVAIGLALGATVWLPAAERVLAYGQHFPNELYTPDKLLQLVGQFAMPITSYSFIVYSGQLGSLFGMWTRRADLVFVGVVVIVLTLGLADGAYLSLGLAPSQSVARLGAIRMMMLVRPFVFAAAAFTLHALMSRARLGWIGAPARQRVVAAALLGIAFGTALRIVPEWWTAESDRALGEANQFATDLEGQRQLEDWATREAAQLAPDRFGRVLFEQTTHEHMHLTARTGLPSFHLSPIPDLLLRERIEDTSEASLARFNVRWIVAAGSSPRLGDEASERQLGGYHVRELKSWDGQFARVERGQGQVKVTRLDDTAVDIVVTAQAPVLVALGTGFYPRWRATHESGTAEPVFALPSFPGSTVHVVAAWVAPGKTTFTCDGPLPSDGRGRLLSLAAALLAIALVIAWSRAQWRTRLLRRFVLLRETVHRYTQVAVQLAVPLAIIALLAAGAIRHGRAQSALLVGSSGMRPIASVEARFIGASEWETCGFSPITGSYRCAGLVNVADGTVNIVNDAPPSWPFITPAITAFGEAFQVEVRIKRTLRLGGVYWLAASAGRADVTIGERRLSIDKAKTVVELGRSEYTVEIVAPVPDDTPLSLVVVAERSLVPARPFLGAPPAQAPASVTAISAAK